MGNFISSLEYEFSGNEKIMTSNLINLSISKVKEYFSAYKHICSNFLINYTEFEQVFGNLGQEFDIWDIHSNKRVDIFEVFTGMALYSDAKPEHKFFFIFDLFDHNEMGTLAFFDMIHLFDTSIQAILKMHKIPIKKITISDEDLLNLLERYAFPTKRLSKSEFQRIILTDPHIKKMLEILEIDNFDEEEVFHINEATFNLVKDDYIKFKQDLLFTEESKKNQINFNPSSLYFSQRFEAYRKLLSTKMKILTASREKNISTMTKSAILDYNINLDWVYGIKLRSVKKPFQYLYSGQSTTQSSIVASSLQSLEHNEAYFYICGKLVIIYYKGQNRQGFYTNHENEVIAVCSSYKNEKICASSEACLKPSIHVWSQETLQTLKIIKGYHQDGIHLLSFAYNSRYLLSVGQRDPSSVIIFDWKTGQIVLSVLMGFVGQDIHTIETGTYKEKYITSSTNKQIELTISSSVVAVVSNEEVFLFYFNKNGVYHFELEINRNVVVSEFTSVCLCPSESNLKINNLNIYEQAEIEENEILTSLKQNENTKYINPMETIISVFEKSQFIVVTGHADGSLIKWSPSSGKMVGILKKYKYPITSVCYFNKGCVISQPEGKLFIWDRIVMQEMFELDFSNSINLLTTKIHSLSVNSLKTSLIITLISGEVIEIKFESKIPDIARFNKIFLVDSINTLTVTNEITPHILFGGETKTLYVIDSEYNEIAYVNNIGHEITTIDTVILQNSDLVIGVGCEDGTIATFKNWDEFPSINTTLFNTRIVDLKFSHDDTLLIVCSGKSVSMLYLGDNSTYSVSKRFELQDASPISIGMNDKFNYLIVITDTLKLFEINLKDFSIYDALSKYAAPSKQKATVESENLPSNMIYGQDKEELDKVNRVDMVLENMGNTSWQSFTLKLPINPKSQSILANSTTFGHNSSIVFSSFEGNIFHFWKDYYSIAENTSEIIRIHNSHVQGLKLSIDDTHLFTGGYNDKMICKWKITQVLNDEGAMWVAFSEKFKNKDDVIINNPLIIAELRSSEFNRFVENPSAIMNKPNLQALSEVTTINNYAQYKGLFDNNILVKGFSSKLLNTLFSKKLQKKLKIENEKTEDNMGLLPQAYLEIEFIHCSHLGEKRNSVAYLHYSRTTDGKIESNAVAFDRRDIESNNYFIKQQEDFIRRIINEDFEAKSLHSILQSINFSKLRQEAAHLNCEKNIIYFHSRLAIIYEPYRKSQRFYQGHRSRISCFAIDYYNNLIATGESCPFPCIHIWKPTTETIKVIDSGHINPIHILKFSSRGKYLLSIDTAFSIQVFLDFHSIVFRNNSKFPIVDAKFFYSERSESKFITIGYRLITVWKIAGNSLYKLKQVESQEFQPNEELKCFELKIFTCVDFMDYILNDLTETDILLGSNFGDISTISCNKYLVLKTGVHEGGINCLKITDLIEEKKYIVITAGEDGLLKIFDQILNLLNVINPYTFPNLLLNKTFSRKYKGIISIDIHNCSPNKFYIMVAFRCGDLIEIVTGNKRRLYDVKLKNIMKGEESPADDKDDEGEDQLTCKQLYSYTYSIPDVNQITYNRSQIHFAAHKTLPIVIINSPDMTLRFYDIYTKDIILTKNVGHTSSCLSLSQDCKILALGMDRGVVGLFDCSMVTDKSSNYFAPSLKPLQTISDYQTKVLAIKFSSEGDFLAISYDNRQKDDPSGKFGGGIVSLYMLRVSKILPNINLRTVTNTLYVKLNDIEIPENQFTNNNMNSKECAVTNIDFSDNSLIVLLSVTKTISLNDESNTNSGSSMFMVWDIREGHLTVDPETLVKIHFRHITMAKAIFSKNLLSYFSLKETTTKEAIKSKDVKDQFAIKKVQLYDYTRLSAITQPRSMSELLVAGNENGFIHVFRRKALEMEFSEVLSFDVDALRNSSMHVARTFAAHSSKICNIDYSMDSLSIFTSSVFDQCVIQFRIMEEDLFSDLDFFWLPMTKDPFLDVMSKNEFVIATEEFWPLRDTIRDVYLNIKEIKSFMIDEDEMNPNELELELTYILGRKAIDKRNNLKYDSNNRLIYTTSSYVLFLKVVNSKFYAGITTINSAPSQGKSDSGTASNNPLLKQENLLPIENFDINIQREISCIAVSSDKKEIAIGHNGNIGSVSVWEINTESMIMSVDFKEASVINMLCFSDDKQKVIGTAIHKFYYNIIFVIDVQTSSIQCSSLNLNSLPFKIKDMCFLCNSNDNFVTVGIQHFGIWRIKGHNLECSNIPIPQHNSEDEHYFDQNDESADPVQRRNNNYFYDLNKQIELQKEQKKAKNQPKGAELSETTNNRFILNNPDKYGVCLLENKDAIYNFALSNNCSNPEEKVKITFLGVAIFDNSIICSTDSGYLYVFSFDKSFFSFKIKTHQSPILAMDYNMKSYLLLTGSMDGTAILYGIIMSKKMNVTSIKKLMIYNTFSGFDIPLKERIINPNYNIQAVCIGMNKVCIGTRSGNILEYIISEDLKIIVNKRNKATSTNPINSGNLNESLVKDKAVLENQNDINMLDNRSSNKIETFIKFQDHDVPISMDFDMYSTRVFTLTRQGNFRVLSLVNFHVEFEHDFKNKAIQSYHFKNQNLILLMFDYQILAIDTSRKDPLTPPQYRRISSFEIQIGLIQEVKVSPNEKLLAISLVLNANPNIYIYDILNGFVLKSILDKFESYIKAMDFSIDSNYLIIEDNVGNTFHFEIQTRRHIVLDELNFEIEWMNDGLKYSDRFRCLPNIFGSDLVRITKISKHQNGKIVAVGDYTGVLRLFTYPAEENDSYFTCRTDHIAKITHIVWSNDQKLLGTISEQDRTIFIYRLV